MTEETDCNAEITSSYLEERLLQSSNRDSQSRVRFMSSVRLCLVDVWQAIESVEHLNKEVGFESQHGTRVWSQEVNFRVRKDIQYLAVYLAVILR